MRKEITKWEFPLGSQSNTDFPHILHPSPTSLLFTFLETTLRKEFLTECSEIIFFFLNYEKWFKNSFFEISFEFKFVFIFLFSSLYFFKKNIPRIKHILESNL